MSIANVWSEGISVMIQEELRKFRLSLGETQESLARRMNLTVRTIARYESDQPPADKALQRFIDLARETGQKEFEQIFFGHIMDGYLYRSLAADRMTGLRLNLAMAISELTSLADPSLTVERARDIGQRVTVILQRASDLTVLGPIEDALRKMVEQQYASSGTVRSPDELLDVRKVNVYDHPTEAACKTMARTRAILDTPLPDSEPGIIRSTLNRMKSKKGRGKK